MGYPLLNVASGIVHHLGADQIIGRRYKGRGSILMGHSVAADRESLIDPQLQVTAGFLDALLTFYAARGIDVLSLDEAVDRLEDGGGGAFVCFTFDDGYRDNLTRALPIFEKHGKPFTVYVPTAFVQRTVDHRWGLLRELVGRADGLRLADGRQVDLSGPARKLRAYGQLAGMLQEGSLTREGLHALAEPFGLTEASVLDLDILSVDELRTLSQSPLVEIGGHTDAHLPLSSLSPDEVRAQILGNKAFLEAATGRPVRHFAYPYGDRASCGEREFEICRQMGFRTATTTRFGGLFTEHLQAHTALPRIRFNGQCESIGFMECQRNGAVTALVTRFGPNVVTA